MPKRRQQLVACREAKGSRDQVASELGISKVYLRMLETGALKPGRDLMLKMSNYFDQPLEVLFPDLFENEQAI
ncbi:MAG: helix-turn-helix transcriptional regulator [Brevibacillus sp.]|nr:helix-turn-helix transcriptional regulator [Brevibacillus sp.]